MSDVLGPRPDHLRPEETAAARVGVDAQQARVLQHDAATPLVLERHFSNDDWLAVEFGMGVADHGDLRIREHDGQR